MCSSSSSGRTSGEPNDPDYILIKKLIKNILIKNLFPMHLGTDLYNLSRSSSPAFFPRTLFFGSELSKKHQATLCLCQPQI